MEEGEQVEKCIICLESHPIKGCLKNDKITHIPIFITHMFTNIVFIKQIMLINVLYVKINISIISVIIQTTNLVVKI